MNSNNIELREHVQHLYEEWLAAKKPLFGILAGILTIFAGIGLITCLFAVFFFDWWWKLSIATGIDLFIIFVVFPRIDYYFYRQFIRELRDQ